ncbi:MAG: hypothetical protein GF341_02160 [candidate division Zixibacteria bacterium]|nr:hypothetical protein [candidate division Zixibacteria bacterium]
MSAMKHLFRRPLILAGVAALIAAGCIVSGQFVILINWGGIVSTNTQLNAETVDLTEDETWQDHQEDIQKIVDVKFETTVKNNAGSVATGQLYVSDQDGLTYGQLAGQATLILSGIEIPAGDSVMISFTESAQYQQNLQTLLDLAETGLFYLYGVAENTPFNIEIKQGSRILVTFAAG